MVPLDRAGRPAPLGPGDDVGAADVEPRRPFRLDDNRRRDLLDDGRPFDRGAGAEFRAVIDRRIDQLAVRRKDRLAATDDGFRRRYALLHAWGLRFVDVSVERAFDIHDFHGVVRFGVGV